MDWTHHFKIYENYKLHVLFVINYMYIKTIYITSQIKLTDLRFL